ncbi:MAG: GTP 3',8-cyclase MoaA [Deltaproteobacteria bacterium]|nr:GTP 3',8-cyclase MoaA [Deltaproteobacteria bacterium]
MRKLRVLNSDDAERAVAPQDEREGVPPVPAAFGRKGFLPLVDAMGRRYRYLRLSVTDRCDMACTYCMPHGGETEHAARVEMLSFEEIERLCRVLASMGVQKVRLTGGEPLLRKELPRLVQNLARVEGLRSLYLSSNASRLSVFASALRQAGLKGVNVSLDSLSPERFSRLTRGGVLSATLDGIRAAIEAGIEVKLNTVLIANENEGEAEAIVDFAWSLGVTPRFIELMPLGAGAELAARSLVSNAQLAERLAASLALNFAPSRSIDDGPARYLSRADEPERRVGFISARTGNFCDACNRIRITANGELRTCLGWRKGLSLRDAMRAGASDREIAWAFHWALSNREDGHVFDAPRRALAASVDHHHVGMSLVGG